LPGIDDCKLTFVFPKMEDVSLLEISIDGGDTYPYSVEGDAGEYKIDNLEKGTYSIFVRDTYSIGDPIPMGKACVSGNCIGTSAEDLLEKTSNINIYPNPSNGLINIDGLEGYSQIEVRDLLGKTYKSISTNTAKASFDISDLPNAFYLISVKNKTRSYLQKINKVN